MKNRRGDTAAPGHDVIKPFASGSASSPLPVSVITLLTDFGTADYFVGAVKGVILSINPAAAIVDITHEIPPHDIEAGAFTLLAAHATFPLKTIHVAVVDPGVGSSRRPILVEAAGQLFVGPDNGIFSYVYDSVKRFKVFHLTNAKYFRQPVSPTFNGRDVFAPVAAALSNGVGPNQLGETIKDFVRLKPLMPEKTRKQIQGRIIHIDRFGNCVTNITRNDIPGTATAKLRVKGTLVKSFRNYFAEETSSRDKIFGVWGSAGFLELAARNDSAAKLLNVRRGETVVVQLR